MEGIPSQLLDLVKDNIVVQWVLAAAFILTVGTNTATKIKGPIGGLARWVRTIGEKRDEREASERREKRLRILQEAAEGREYVQTEIEQLRGQIGYLYQNQEALEGLIRVHLGWDYERIRQLTALGVKAGEIPAPPPLRVELRNPDTVPQAKVSERTKRRHAATDTDENPQVQRASE
jgi:hypothetical protein